MQLTILLDMKSSVHAINNSFRTTARLLINEVDCLMELVGINGDWLSAIVSSIPEKRLRTGRKP